jgi:hypothetical protein
MSVNIRCAFARCDGHHFPPPLPNRNQCVVPVGRCTSVPAETTISLSHGGSLAIALNPRYAKAHAKFAWGHLCDIALGYSADAAVSMTKARAAAKAAVQCDDGEAWSHWAIAGCDFFSGQHDSALATMRRAIELNPNDADVLTDMGLFCSCSGRAEEGLGFALKAMRLNPHYPEYYAAQLGVIYFDARRYEDAVRTLPSLRTLDTPLWGAYLAASQAALGHDDLTKSAVTHLLVADPAATVTLHQPSIGALPRRPRPRASGAIPAQSWGAGVMPRGRALTVGLESAYGTLPT